MSHNHQVGMAGGSITGIWASINTSDLLTTCLMAALGTIVSYFVSMFLKRIFGKKVPE
ncbi:MAG: hypothetical protein IPG48_07125 [Saprospiraceae bacterium]|nr:hypothetical protein [Saprospiraceae bacterium]MBK6665921.1 hypothetical protein [Saprospiraceae bacterium]MBK8828663.1 hypothetical protein [Saprospiraceae bacterium]MBK8887547.1 hypothetical protein [Saprospiraceae bacterium]